MKGGTERDGTLFAMEVEKLKDARLEAKLWLQKIKHLSQNPYDGNIRNRFKQ